MASVKLSEQTKKDIVADYDNLAKDLAILSDNVLLRKAALLREISKQERGCSSDEVLLEKHSANFSANASEISRISVAWYKTLEPLCLRRKELNNLELETVNLSGEFVVLRIGETVYIKMPKLPLKKYRKHGLYKKELNLKLDETKRTIGLPSIPKKFIRIIHIYATTADETYIPDNDNYDINGVINTVTDYIGCGDSGPNCSIMLDTIISDEISEGCYIIASPKDSKNFTEKTIDDLKKLFTFSGQKNE